MKKLLLLLAAAGLVFVSGSCDEDYESQQQSVRVGLTILSDDGTATNPPTGSRVVVTVESPDGTAVSELEEVYSGHDGRFSLKPFSLPAGAYRIKDVAIVDDSDRMLYAVPRQNSRLAADVPQPGSFDFRVLTDQAPAELNFHLLEVRRYDPQDFGYPSFHFIRGFFLLTITAEDSNKPLAAKALIMDGNETIKEYSLREGINKITLPTGIEDTHRLLIFSDGYSKAEYNLVGLLNANPSRILKVALKPAFTMLAFIDYGEPFEFDLGAVGGGSISIDWGDGVVESHALQPESANDRVSHSYPKNGSYPVAITGDLNNITFFSSAYGLSMMDAVNFQHLRNIREISISLTRSPRVIDLRSNMMLKVVSMAGVDVEKIYLPRVHQITLLGLGPMPITAENVNAIVDNIYANVVSQNLTSGELSLLASWEDEQLLLGPPSVSSLKKMRSLRDDFGWILYPDPFPSDE